MYPTLDDRLQLTILTQTLNTHFSIGDLTSFVRVATVQIHCMHQTSNMFYWYTIPLITIAKLLIYNI